MLRLAKASVSQALVEIGKVVQTKGVAMDEIIELGQDLRGNLVGDEYGLDEQEDE